MTRQVSAGFGVRKCAISHLHKNRIQRGQYNVPQSVAICLAVCLLRRPCCIIGNVRFAYAASQQRKGSRQQDVRLTGSQDHRVLCKYLAITFWRAKINLQAVGYIRRVCLRFLSDCHVCVCVSYVLPPTLRKRRRERGRGREGGRNTCPLLLIKLLADPLLTPRRDIPIHTFIHSFILSALIRQAEFTGIRSGSEDQDVLRALFEYFSSTIRGENLKDIRPENSHVHFAYITIALPYPISLSLSLSQFCSWVPTSFFAAFLVGFLEIGRAHV